MKMIYALSGLVLLSGTAHAAMPKVLFGGKGLDAPLVAGEVRTVVGPLLQLQTEDGTVLALQRGARFTVSEEGILELQAGNLRVGPAGMADVSVKLPQGELKVAPLTAATITAGEVQSTGKVYQGTLVADARTFGSGEGFVLAEGGARGTFSPAAAQAPAVDGAPENLDEIVPAGGGGDGQAPPEAVRTQQLRVAQVDAPPALPTAVTETPAEPEVVPPVVQPEEPVVEEPVVETPAPEPEEPVVEEPPVEEPLEEQPPVTVPEIPQVEEPVVTPPEEPVVEEPPVENPPVETPEVEQPPVTEPEVETPPVEEPVVEIPEPEVPVVPEPEPEKPVVEVPPVTYTQGGLLAAWSGNVDGIFVPTGLNSGQPGEFTLEQFADGTRGLVATETRYFEQVTGRLERGTAEAKEVASDGAIAGLGRWVGGDLVVVKEDGAQVPMALGNGSFHYLWGERATQIPTTGRVTYSLLAATQPTYTGAVGEAMDSSGGLFEGSLAVNFAQGRSGRVGTYELNGTVTMPQVETAEDGSSITRNVTYGLATQAGGATLYGNQIADNVLNVTAETGAAACPSGCTGQVTVGGFGTGMKDVGALYAINPGADVGVAGAALFTKD